MVEIFWIPVKTYNLQHQLELTIDNIYVYSDTGTPEILVFQHLWRVYPPNDHFCSTFPYNVSNIL